MIVRIVKLTLQPDQIPAFMGHFARIKDKIRHFPGCTYLELLQESGNSGVIFTYSHWESESQLDGYLRSEFFRDTWSRVKPLFAAPASAWSLTRTGESEG